MIEKEAAPEFSVRRGGEPARHVAVRAAMTIGRGTDCDIVLAGRFVSRVHARVEPKGERFAIIDAGSKNGVFVNGRLLKAAHVLEPGDGISHRGSPVGVRREPGPHDGALR